MLPSIGRISCVPKKIFKIVAFSKFLYERQFISIFFVVNDEVRGPIFRNLAYNLFLCLMDVRIPGLSRVFLKS